MESINDIISESWVSFEASKLTDSNARFINCGLDEQSSFPDWREAAWVVPETPCFSGLDIERKNSVVLLAEPYGGPGVGSNGGAGRCGTLGNLQVKGVGATPLVGDHNDEEHSYGGLDARKAIVETVYTIVLGSILPQGTVKIHGLILTGNDTALDGNGKCWGMLMIRDGCIRPAHFMRAAGFKPKPCHKGAITGDLGRIRRVHRRLATYFEDTNAFIKWIGNHLQSMASQMAFARMMRITHGTMSPSNISWEGKWLDLPVASFLSGGVNYNIHSQFYAEPQMVLTYALEIVHTYAKYNDLMLDPEPLVNYYNEQLQEYCHYYLGYVLGLDVALNEAQRIGCSNWRTVSDIFIRTLSSGTIIEPRRPQPDPDDPVVALILSIFLLVAGSGDNGYLHKTGLNDEDIALLRQSASALFRDYIRRKTCEELLPESVFMCCFLKAAKRSWLSEIWYLPNIDNSVVEMCRHGSPEEVEIFISMNRSLSNWVFRDDQLDITLFLHSRLQITYNPLELTFVVLFDGKMDVFTDFDLLMDRLHYLKEYLSTPIYNFYEFFRRLRPIVKSITKINI